MIAQMKKKLIVILVICFLSALFLLVCVISAFQTREIQKLNKKLAVAEAQKMATYQYILDLESINRGVTNAKSSDDLLNFFNNGVSNLPTDTNNDATNPRKTKNRESRNARESKETSSILPPTGGVD